MSAATSGHLIIFTRFPEPGKTKTRLIPALGAQGAARLQRQMTEHVISKVAKMNNRDGMAIEVRYEGGSSALMQDWLGPGFRYRPQGSGDIGQRMGRAFQEGFQGSKAPAVIIGSDIPGISADIVQQAFDALQKNDLVLGPARDGGYYLIGLKNTLTAETYLRLFDGIRWGTAAVVSQTLEIAKMLELRYVLLETLDDVDGPEDLQFWENAGGAAGQPAGAQTISIIIPALNEAATIAKTLAHLKCETRLEVIVVDGGSKDGTVELAGSHGVRVIQSKPGKAVQMNAGAAAAAGDILVFLHADTLLPEDFGDQIVSALNQKGVAAGAFRLSIDSSAAGLRIIERTANWRARFLRLPYGDQALFTTKALFKKIGGFPDMPIMEDYVLVRRLKRNGRIVIAPAAVVTSPRRWLQMGILKTWLINQLIIIAYYLGASPEHLTRLYRRDAGKRGA
jgi:rSAM/selenodomain-associated transferase 2/rSAM/selenodomain-associated transferase 1